jgi:hypothetical protein
VKLEDKMLGKVALITPDDPAYTGVYQAELLDLVSTTILCESLSERIAIHEEHSRTYLVARSVDRLHPRQLKVPLVSISLRMRERSDETSRSSVHVNRNVNASLLLVFIEDVVDLPNRLVVASVCASENDKNTNGILVNVVLHKLGIKAI